MASVLRAARLSLSRGLPLQHRQLVPTPCAAAVVDTVRGTLQMSSSSLRSPQLPLRPPAPGRATPDMNLTWRFNSAVSIYKEGLDRPFRRRFTTDRNFEKSNLPVLTQAEFFDEGDIKDAEWLDVISFLEKHPAVMEACKHNKMIPEGGDRPWMLTGIGRGLWLSAAQLVVFNKLRGHDIGRGLMEENVQKVYGLAVLSLLTLDVPNFLDSLENVPDDRLPLYHAVFLSPFGRAWLSIRLHSLVRFEVILEGPWVSIDSIHELLVNLPDIGEDGKEKTDEMHIIFRCLRLHGETRKARDAQDKTVVGEASAEQPEGEAQDKTVVGEASAEQPEGESPLKKLDDKRKLRITSGYSVVAIHRNGVLHRVLRKVIEKQAKSEKAEGRFVTGPPHVKGVYRLWEIVQLLHYYMPLHLPRAQQLARENNLWVQLEMGAPWPRDEIYHFMTRKRLGPTPSMKANSMFTYRSDLALAGKTNSDEDSNTSRIHIGGLGPTISEEDLGRIFGAYGIVVDVKNFGFVEFSTRASAEKAMKMLNGLELGCGPVSLSFARPAMKKGPVFGTQGPLLGGHYAHPQTYDNYAWAMEVLERDKEKIRQIKEFAVRVKIGPVD